MYKYETAFLANMLPYMGNMYRQCVQTMCTDNVYNVTMCTDNVYRQCVQCDNVYRQCVQTMCLTTGPQTRCLNMTLLKV